jgi:hypothetical protein
MAQIVNNRRSSLPYMSTPPNSRELGRSSAQAARTNKVDSNDRALFKFNKFVFSSQRALLGVLFRRAETLSALECMGDWICSITSMVVIHLVVDDSVRFLVLARLAIM